MHVSSALDAVCLQQSPAPLLIGERLNILGSRRTRDMALGADYEGLLEVARQQVADGAHCLDVCMAHNDMDEHHSMMRLVKLLSETIPAPLVLDSTDPELLAKAVRQTPGRPIINSINLENHDRFDRIAPIMRQYGVPAVAMCIGPDGMAETALAKLETAELLYEYGKRWDLNENQYVFDVLVFPIAAGTNPDTVKETLEGIRLVKRRFPEACTVLGISNVSMSMKPYARKRVNSVFLHHAVKAGLDAAIVDVAGIIPYHTIPNNTVRVVEDVLFNRRPDSLERLENHFAGRAEDASRRPDIDPAWSASERARFRIVNQMPRGIEEDVKDAITDHGGNHDAAISVLNDSLLPAMKEVGDMFGNGDIILAAVLKSAESMKAATAELEKHLDRQEGASKGTIVLGTVYGDVHDIGKNLTKTILQNNGYTVHDLGKQVPMQAFLDATREHKADAVGLSALLVNTSKQMRLFVEHARNNGLDLPILCGGAAINSNYINRIAKDGEIYDRVFYCNTMFDGLDVMESLVHDRAEAITLRRRQLEKWKDKKYSFAAKPSAGIVPVKEPPVPHDLSVRRVVPPMGQVWNHLDLNELFKVQWGLIGKAGKAMEKEYHAVLEDFKERLAHLLKPEATFGFFKCAASGDTLRVFKEEEKFDFAFPRTRGGLCLADYFGKDDVVAFQAVTVGRKVGEVLASWESDGRYTDYYHANGLASESAEAVAAWCNGVINSEWGIPKSVRYSWGYPSCPDVMQHKMVWDLLEPDGIGLTEAGQIMPEQSTAAIVVHHPKAKYFGGMVDA